MEDKDIFDRLEGKVDRKTFWIVIPIIFTALINLYIIFVSGLIEVKVDVATLLQKTTTMELQINEINDTFKDLNFRIE